METHPVINEEDNESSKITEQTNDNPTVVLEESKMDSNNPDMSASIDTATQEKLVKDPNVSISPLIIGQNENIDSSVDMSLANFKVIESKPLYNENSCFELNTYLYSKYQSLLEEAETVSKTPADETRPFDYKYKAREMLEEILKADLSKFENTKSIKTKIEAQIHAQSEENKSNNVKESDQNSESIKYDSDLVHLTVAKGQIYYLLGINYFESEEYSESEKHLQIGLKYINTLPKTVKILHVNMIQDIYNNLGIIHCNRDNHKKGLPYFVQAEKIYELIKCIKSSCPTINNSMKPFLRNCKTDNRTSQARDSFSFFIDGGIDKTRVERNYTLTLFYMAQVYTRLQKNEKAVTY